MAIKPHLAWRIMHKSGVLHTGTEPKSNLKLSSRSRDSLGNAFLSTLRDATSKTVPVAVPNQHNLFAYTIPKR